MLKIKTMPIKTLRVTVMAVAVTTDNSFLDFEVNQKQTPD